MTPDSTRGGRRFRLRGNKAVRNSGLTLLATSIVSAITYDLKQPDSIVRGLIGSGYRALKSLAAPRRGQDVSDLVDVTDVAPAEIIEDESKRKE